jgi:GNAT superfamily N-acetyltransferase
MTGADDDRGERATKGGRSVRIRPAVGSDLEHLSGLALRSKAHWGYDAAFLEACRAELTITPDRLAGEHVRVAEEDGAVLGFVCVRLDGEEAELMDLFVEPRRIGSGVGRALWEEAVSLARSGGAVRLAVEADPHAEDWYRRRGAERIGTAPSGSIPGRRLPLLRLSLSDGGDGPPADALDRRDPGA